MDHVPLPLKKIVNAPHGILSDREILTKLLTKIRKEKTSKRAEAS